MDAIGTRQTLELFQSKKRQAGLEHAKRFDSSKPASRSRECVQSRHGDASALAEKEVDFAIRRYSQSKKRMDADVSPSREIDLSSIEVMPSIGALDSRQNYLQAVISYNKAQVELLYLIGAGGDRENYNLPDRPPNRYVNGRPVAPVQQASPERTMYISEQAVKPGKPVSRKSPPASPVASLDLREPVSDRVAKPAYPESTEPGVPLIPVETIADEPDVPPSR